MLRVRQAKDATKNAAVSEFDRRPHEGNVHLIQRILASDDSAGDELKPPAVYLFGGNDLIHFRHRIAQSHLRADMLPSFWSRALIAVPRDRENVDYVHAGFEGHAALGNIPACNAITNTRLDVYDDPSRYPNVGVFTFPGVTANDVDAAIDQLRKGRLVVDLVGPMIEWLAFSLGAHGRPNPLLSGTPEPSALFVSHVLAGCGVDATPGTSDTTACPEAIWQAALWWSKYYEETAPGTSDPASQSRVFGAYVLDQRDAAATG